MTKQKTNPISTCLWFDEQGEEAAEFYVAIFNNAKLLKKIPYLVDTPSDKPVGSTMSVDFELEGQRFMALNGGPIFTPNPSISFFVNCDTEEEVDRLWAVLSEGGTSLMPLDSYPFSDKYGWVQDQYGISWQLILAQGNPPQKIMPSLMFGNKNVNKAEEAINFYANIFNDSRIGNIVRYPEETGPAREGSIMYGDFMIQNTWMAAMDSGTKQDFSFNEAISLVVSCKTQEDIDYYWEKLSTDPNAEQCGWLKDQFGVSWQIIPEGMERMFQDGNQEKSKRAMEAMLQMKKINIAELEQAYGHG